MELLVALQIEAGIVVDVGFRDGDPTCRRHLRKQRQGYKPRRLNAADGAHLVVIFIRGLEGFEDQRIECRIHAVVKLRELAGNARGLDGGLFGNEVAESESVVEDSDFDG